jgi:hypothetical protein
VERLQIARQKFGNLFNEMKTKLIKAEAGKALAEAEADHNKQVVAQYKERFQSIGHECSTLKQLLGAEEKKYVDTLTLLNPTGNSYLLSTQENNAVIERCSAEYEQENQRFDTQIAQQKAQLKNLKLELANKLDRVRIARYVLIRSIPF